LVASVAPVWILLQPRDYLSSYLLYGMIILALIAIVGATIFGGTHFTIPAVTGFDTTNMFTDAKVFGGRGLLFPSLFVTIACGAISGFHSLVASGTTSKQVDRESEAQPIAYGGMLLECLLAIISLCAVAFVWSAVTSGDYATPTQVFAGGLSAMMAQIPGMAGLAGEAGSLVYSLLILAVSAFCLTSLDTATRISRMMFQEMFATDNDERTNNEKGWRGVLTNTYVATIISVVCGIVLGMTGYAVIWPLFGAANQLLAALALLAVCSFLGNLGRNNKMFYFPMIFMLIVTLTSLVLTSIAKIKALAAGFAFAPFIQLVLAVALFVLAIILAIKACKHIFGMAKKNA
ncbi:MAG: carbon starvation protein A, partial [Eggerthellaceae bacterium]|nr:carbon starvation protein A [Eggerthellaceae bacterium]